MNISDFWWLFLFGGGLVVFIAFMRIDDGARPTLASRVVFILGLFSVVAGLSMVMIEAHRPFTKIWMVDQVQYMEDGRDLLVVNYRDERGAMQPQYRQLMAPKKLALLLQEIARGEKVPTEVTVQPGESYNAIVQIRVWRDRFSPSETYNF